MFVFPANNEGYRKRKRALKACEQCKRRRKRCDFPIGSVRCEPCQKADIMCSLAPTFELMERESRLDNLARQSMMNETETGDSGGAGMTGSQNIVVPVPTRIDSNGTRASHVPPQPNLIKPIQTPPIPSPSRPGLNKRSSSANSVVTLNSFSQPSIATPASPISTAAIQAQVAVTRTPASSIPTASAGPSLFRPLKLTSDTTTKRPGMGPRATSYTHANSSTTSSQIRKQQNQSHRRTGSHSPGLTNKTLSHTNGHHYQPTLPNSSSSSSSPPTSSSVDRESIGVWVKGVTSQQRLDPHLHTYLASINAFSMPLRFDREALIKIYAESIDKILPLLDLEQFTKLHSIGQAPTLLLHAVLLAAARHPRAARHLGHESVRQFCASTAAKIRALLFAEVEQDRLTLVRIYALLSLHSEGPDGLENSCSDLQKSLHYATSLGIHHDRAFIDKEQLRKLWWSIWCMDRISACVNARPLIIANEDIGLACVRPEEHQQLCRLIVACEKLEKVIRLYRPGFMKNNPCVVPEEVDELFMGDDTIDPLNAIQALLHHSAVILAHKRVSSDEEDTFQEETVVTEVAGLSHAYQEKRQSLPPQTLQTLSTPLTMILAQEKQKAQQAINEETFTKRFNDFLTTKEEEVKESYQPKMRPDSDSSFTDTRLLSAAGSVLRIIKNTKDLPPLPLIPYCVSLTLTVFLRTFPRVDSETGFSWKDSCSVLENMADRWWIGGAMSSMGRNVFASLEAEMVKQEVLSVMDDDNEFQVPMEQYLDMFSTLPNQTSFIDEALSLDGFNNIEPWFQEKR